MRSWHEVDAVHHGTKLVPYAVRLSEYISHTVWHRHGVLKVATCIKCCYWGLADTAELAALLKACLALESATDNKQ